MQYNFVIIRTEKGGRYARKILRSIKWLNENKYPQHHFLSWDFTISEFMDMAEDDDFFGDIVPPENTIIHARCANPRTEWTIKLRELEELGYKVVNSVDCIELTSNKLACSLHLQGKVNHPKSWEWDKRKNDNQFTTLVREIDASLESPEFIIAKPITSLEQGANVKKIKFNDFDRATGEDYIPFLWIKEKFNEVPGNKIVIQEYIPYIALHRVIVIGGKALPYTFIDKPEWHENGDWKVSCCLNRTTMILNENANQFLLELAEKTQKEIGGVINFIDIFEIDSGVLILLVGIILTFLAIKNNDNPEWDDDGFPIIPIWILAILLDFFGTVVALCSIRFFLNPEWYAVKLLIETFVK